MKKTILLLISVTLVIFTSCTDFLHEDSRSTIDPESFYQNAKQAESGVMAIYSSLTGQYGFYKIFPMTELPTDQGRVGYAGDIVLTAMDNLTYDANNTNFTNFWQHAYRTINRANMAIHKIPDVPDLSDENKNILVAESRFFRTLFYFNLVRWFGDVPLVTDYTKDIDNLEVPRDPEEKIYELMVEDLIFASQHLPETWSQANTGRVVRAAAQVTLAKVYITMAGYPLGQTDKWQAAVNLLDDILQQPYSDYLFDTIEELWDEANENSKEHIFSSQFEGGITNNTLLPICFTPRSSGVIALQSAGEIAPTEEFYNSFDPLDERLKLMKTEYPHYSSGQMVQFDIPFCFKYFDVCEGGRGGRNFPILRYADALLLYAEALNEVSYGNSKAFNAINAIRNRVNLPDLRVEDMDQVSFREAVYDERNKELCFEGHRWFDLKRTGRFIESMRTIGKNADEHHLVFPIPQREMDANPSLVQNDKY